MAEGIRTRGLYMNLLFALNLSISHILLLGGKNAIHVRQFGRLWRRLL